MDIYNIDGHKLMLHPEQVADWRQGKDVEPIYMEVSPSGACNHRCKFCALDYLGYKPNYLDVANYVKFIDEMAINGLKSVMFGGEGEPLMHRHFEELVAATQSRGIDCALTTNGVLLRPERAKNILSLMKWIKISVDAGTDITYGKIHSTSCSDWEILWRNVKYLVDNKNKCKIGLQFLLLPDNKESVWDFLKQVSDIGNVDYVVFKQYSQNLNSKNKQANCYLHPHEVTDMRKNFLFDIIVREDKSKRSYNRCLALQFWRYLQANGDLWACSAHLGDKRFVMGNIGYDWNTINWEFGINEMMQQFDISNCRLNCRMNNCNEYLNRLINPMEHDNFI